MTIGNGMKIGIVGTLILGLALLQSYANFAGPHIDIKDALKQENVIPLVIIGSGQAGLTASIYGARGMVRTVVIEGGKPGGLLTQTTEVENWPGERTIMGPKLMEKIRKHAQDLGVEFLQDSVEEIDFSSWPYVIKTENGQVMRAMALIIATGANPLYLGIPGEQEFLGRGVGTCAICDASFYKNEDVAVVGGGDSAIEEAIQLSQYAKSVTILVRKDSMRAAPRMQARLKDYPSIKVLYNVEVKKIVGDNIHVTGLDLITSKKEKSHLPINGFFLAIGHTPNSKIFSDNVLKKYVTDKKYSFFGYQVGIPQSGIVNTVAWYLARKAKQGMYVETDEKGYIKTIGRTQATSVPGVFVAGEVEDNHYRQAIVESGRGSSAALDALAFLTEIGLTPAIARQLDKKALEEGAVTEPQAELAQLGSLRDLNSESDKDDSLMVLDFYTDSCVTCKQMLPLVTSLTKDFQGKARFFKVNAEKATDIVEKFFVYKVPCLVVIKNGKLLARFNDTMTRAELVDFVEQFLTK